MSKKQVLKRYISVLILTVIFVSGLFITASFSESTSAGELADGTPSFLPLIFSPQPTPIPPMPQFVKNIPLPEAQCPNYVLVNEVTDLVYIANNFSNNISFLRDTTYLGTALSGGNWPTRITMIPENGRTFITNLHSSGSNGSPSLLAEFDGTTLVHTYNEKFEGYTPLYNTVNQFLYVTDLDSTIRIFDASVSPAVFVKDLGPSDGILGWIKAITYDPTTGVVYAASWDYGQLYVINGLSVTAVINTNTWGPDQLLFDPVRKYIYVAGQEVENRPQGFPANNITVFNAKLPYQFLNGFTTAKSTHRLAYDPISQLVYAANPKDDSVTIVNGLQLIGTVPVGEFPHAVAVNPNTGYAFVANTNSNTISILKNGGLITTIPSQGKRPFSIGIDTRNNNVYIANRGTEGHLSCPENASVTILQ